MGQYVAMAKKCDAQCRVANGAVMDYVVMPMEGQLAWCSERRPMQLACSSAQHQSREPACVGHVLAYATCVLAWSDQGRR